MYTMEGTKNELHGSLVDSRQRNKLGVEPKQWANIIDKGLIGAMKQSLLKQNKYWSHAPDGAALP
jgi:hypothetical protein